VVSEPIFTEEDAQEGEPNTIVLDLNGDSDHSNDADH
jgi:hypothetical protein